jgi:hypothetical protein
MKRETEKRIERLESKNNFTSGVRAVFVQYVWPGHIDRPVAGWSFGEDAERVEVLRGEGEKDDILKQRALALARKHTGEQGTPCLTSVG